MPRELKLAEVLLGLAHSIHDDGRPAEAEPHFRRALEILRALEPEGSERLLELNREYEDLNSA